MQESTDCRAAIFVAFCNGIPNYKIKEVIQIKRNLADLRKNDNQIQVHLISEHKNIAGNELAEQRAKIAAQKMNRQTSEEDIGPRDKTSIWKPLKQTYSYVKKWNKNKH